MVADDHDDPTRLPGFFIANVNQERQRSIHRNTRTRNKNAYPWRCRRRSHPNARTKRRMLDKYRVERIGTTKATRNTVSPAGIYRGGKIELTISSSRGDSQLTTTMSPLEDTRENKKDLLLALSSMDKLEGGGWRRVGNPSGN